MPCPHQFTSNQFHTITATQAPPPAINLPKAIMVPNWSSSPLHPSIFRAVLSTDPWLLLHLGMTTTKPTAHSSIRHHHFSLVSLHSPRAQVLGSNHRSTPPAVNSDIADLKSTKISQRRLRCTLPAPLPPSLLPVQFRPCPAPLPCPPVPPALAVASSSCCFRHRCNQTQRRNK
jgi:hypothetical protein